MWRALYFGGYLLDLGPFSAKDPGWLLPAFCQADDVKKNHESGTFKTTQDL